MHRRIGTAVLTATMMAGCSGEQDNGAEADRTAADNAGVSGPVVTIDADDIGGVVNGPDGPEAGVWVIAETYDLPTGYRKIVVTDEAGRYVLPDLPAASYDVWVRGYGLVDSEPVAGTPGRQLALNAVPAPSEQAAARYYPANYWHSLLDVPPNEEFPMANGAETQAEWVAAIKGCQICHQMGSEVTREIASDMGDFESSVEAWDFRIRQGQNGAHMLGMLNGIGLERSLEMYADWTDRIEAGEVPRTPPRPEGRERNVVVTQWDIATPTSFLHDFYGTDKRDPTVNAGGVMVAGDFNLGDLWVLDPNEHTVENVKMPYLDPPQLMSTFSPQAMENPSPVWGRELVAQERQRTEVQNVDSEGDLWMMLTFRTAENPGWCREGSDNRFARLYPLDRSGRQAAYYDLDSGHTVLMDTCFTTHHGIFGEGEDEIMYNAALGLPSAIGWINTDVYKETGDAELAQGWCPSYYDINQNGTYDPDGEDRLVGGNGYYITYNPVDGSLWYAYPDAPGMIIRVDIGDNPPATCQTEAYAPPYYNDEVPNQNGTLPRGIDVDRNGLIWTGLAGSGHLASFDRSLCEIQEGPGKFDPQHCPEGWTLYPFPGPQMNNIEEGGSADFAYSNFVDQFNIFGLGENVPFATGTGSDSLLALLPETEQWLVLRVPYPMGFFTRNMTGRIDDPDAGWKGRGLWAANEVRNPWHIEGGRGTTPTAAKFQLRPDPLAH